MPERMVALVSGIGSGGDMIGLSLSEQIKSSPTLQPLLFAILRFAIPYLMRIEYHRTLLADQIRNAAFHEALRRVIVKGQTTVADIGAGTGFLGFLASKLGAKRVDFYERADIADVARKLLRHNRLTNCRIAEIHSTDVATPDRVDVVVSETLGNYPFEENI